MFLMAPFSVLLNRVLLDLENGFLLLQKQRLHPVPTLQFYHGQQHTTSHASETVTEAHASIKQFHLHCHTLNICHNRTMASLKNNEYPTTRGKISPTLS
jgi:hypothetical protein